MIPFVLGLLVSCGPEPSVIEGSIDSNDFSDPLTAYFGGRYLFFSNVEFDCMGVDWVHHSYTPGVDPAEQDLLAIQFTFGMGSEVAAGYYNLNDRAQVDASALVIRGGAFQEFRVDEGEITIDELEDRELVIGNFDLSRFYDTEEGSLSGTFSAEWCVNLPD